MSQEAERLKTAGWKKWGPYVSNRQWGTVREDYSAHGDVWNFATHDMARSKAWRWGEEGIGGISDDKQLLCFAPAFWNGNDTIVKEILYGLSNAEGNHGEDVKELYYYLDSSPTHSYMKMLYKYPQQAFPYNELIFENRKRSRQDPEYELIDTGIFDNNEYFDIFIEYAKSSQEDLLIKITAHNRAATTAPLTILPTVWLRNRWSWGNRYKKSVIHKNSDKEIEIQQKSLGNYYLYTEDDTPWLFTENETNHLRLHKYDDGKKYYKDGINEYIVNHKIDAVNPEHTGTKAAANCKFEIEGGQSAVVKLRLCKGKNENPFSDFDDIFELRLKETDEFYKPLQSGIKDDDEKLLHRQSLAGLLWNKQFYNYNVSKWLQG